MSSLLEDRQLKYIKTGTELVIETVKSVLEHLEGEERMELLEEQRQQILEYLRLEIKYTTGKSILKNLEEHLKTKEGTMDTDMVAEFEKRYEEELKNKAKELTDESLKKNPKYLKVEQLISSKLGGGLADDEDLVCAEEETRQYIDPWSKKKIEIPVKNKVCGHHYDKETALKMLQRSKGKVKCPVVGCSNNNLKQTELEVDQEVQMIIASRNEHFKMSEELRLVTCTAPVNIAVIKYWGKRDEKLILPINDSISVTLSSEQMHAKTTVTASSTFLEDKIWLNKELQASSSRLSSCLEEVRAKARQLEAPAVNPDWKVRICSENNFPTAAGLASSAAGYACLVSALCQLYGIKGDTSILARRGSGSACRSVYGGFVHWKMGERADGEDSRAFQLHPACHWPEMRVLICVASDTRKKTSSSTGMKNSVQTSQLLKYRAEEIVPKRTLEMIEAIKEKDFSKFAQITIKDSNQFHAVCQDTYPPCVYLNPTSHQVSSLVHQINNFSGRFVATYTFDAGPNACIFLMEKDVPKVLGLLKYFFAEGDEFVRGEELPMEEATEAETSKYSVDRIAGGLKYVICTRPGEGPEVLAADQHLLNNQGEPKFMQ